MQPDQGTRQRRFRTIKAALAVLMVVSLAPRVLAEILVDPKTKRYHMPDCSEIQPQDLKKFKKLASVAEAGGKGYYPCPVCMLIESANPLLGQNGKRSLSREPSRPIRYWGDPATKLYHYAWCPKLPNDKLNLIGPQEKVEILEQKGFSACPECNPPHAARPKPALIPASVQEPESAPPEPTLPGNGKSESGKPDISDPSQIQAR